MFTCKLVIRKKSLLTIKSQINKSSSYCIVVIADHAIFQFNIDLIPSDKNNKTDVENFVLDTHNPDHFIPISTVGTFNLKKNRDLQYKSSTSSGYFIMILLIENIHRKQKSKMFNHYFSSLNFRSLGYLDRNSIELYSSTPMQGII